MQVCYHCMNRIQDDRAHTCPSCGKPLHVEQENASSMLPPGTVLDGKFLIGYAIGFGGFGITYIGWDQLLQRKVAVKEFYPRQFCQRLEDGVTVTLTEQKMRDRYTAGLKSFLQEARSLASLQETVKGIVAITNYFEANGTGYIIMEYLEGMDVKNILKKSGGTREYEWCRQVVLSVLCTLKEIHRQGILHRDIAPDNVFITKEGVIKLIDFGAAKHESDLIAQDAAIVLKVGYAPIEQYSRTAQQGPYTDLYAVAALFYRMLTGRKPAPANERVSEDTLVPPSELGITIPEQAEMAIMVCLNIRPSYRLQSASEFMEALGGKGFVPRYEPDWILPEDMLTEGRKKLSAPVKGAILFGTLVLLGGGMFAAAQFMNSEKNIQVTQATNDSIMVNCVGMTKEEAISQLQQNGIAVEEKITYEYSTDTEQNVVMDQSIRPGTTLQQDDIVELTVSGGTKMFSMPDVSQMSKEEVNNYFTEKGITVSVRETFSDSVKKGKVVLQSIAAGEDFVVADTPKLVVEYSLGAKKDYDIPMPDLEGKTKQEAKKILYDKGLKQMHLSVKQEKVFSEMENDTIIDQSVKAGKTVNKMDEVKVEVTLSKGPKPEPTMTPTPKPVNTPKPKKKAVKKTKKKHQSAVENAVSYLD